MSEYSNKTLQLPIFIQSRMIYMQKYHKLFNTCCFLLVLSAQMHKRCRNDGGKNSQKSAILLPPSPLPLFLSFYTSELWSGENHSLHQKPSILVSKQHWPKTLFCGFAFSIINSQKSHFSPNKNNAFCTCILLHHV